MSNELQSNESAVERKEFQFPTHINEAYSELRKIDDQIRRLDSMKKQLRKFIARSIPVEADEEDPNRFVGEVDGVRRLQFKQHRVQYRPAMEQIIEKLVPKTKHEDAQGIIENNTKEIWIDRFSFSSDEGDFE